MISQLWYYDPYMLYELIRLKSDKCCRRMQAIAEMNGRVHLYVIHSVGAPEIHNLNPLDEANDFPVPNVGVVLEEIVEEGQNVGGAGLNLPMIEYPVGINGEMAMGEAMVEDQGSVEYMVEKEGSAEIMVEKEGSSEVFCDKERCDDVMVENEENKGDEGNVVTMESEVGGDMDGGAAGGTNGVVIEENNIIHKQDIVN